MFRHVIMFRWKAEASEAQKQAAYEGLARLPEAIPEIRSWQQDPDVGLLSENLDFVLIADFDDQDAYLVYRNHPVHLRLIAECITPILERLERVQFLTG